MEKRFEASDKGEGGLWVWSGGNIVRDVGPETDGRQSSLAAGIIQHPDDSRWSLITGRGEL